MTSSSIQMVSGAWASKDLGAGQAGGGHDGTPPHVAGCGGTGEPEPAPNVASTGEPPHVAGWGGMGEARPAPTVASMGEVGPAPHVAG